jgi:hypothetical protein
MGRMSALVLFALPRTPESTTETSLLLVHGTVFYVGHLHVHLGRGDKARHTTSLELMPR